MDLQYETLPQMMSDNRAKIREIQHTTDQDLTEQEVLSHLIEIGIIAMEGPRDNLQKVKMAVAYQIGQPGRFQDMFAENLSNQTGTSKNKIKERPLPDLEAAYRVLHGENY